MKKRIFFPIVVMAALFTVGCVEDTLVEPETGTTVLTAGIQTKTVLQNDAQVLWTNGDKINVNGVESAALALDAPAAMATFSFDGVLSTPYKAVFPSSIYKSESVVTLPARQSYTSGSFGNTAAPMVAVSDNNSLEFVNLCSVLKLTIGKPSGDDHSLISHVEFRGNASEQVSGDFTIDYSSMTITGSSTASSDKKVTYTVSKTFNDDALVMYIVVPAQNYAQGYTVKVIDNQGHYMEKSKGAQNLEAGKVYEMPAFDFAPTGTELDVEIATASDLVKFAKDYNEGKYADQYLLTVALVQDITFDAATSAAYAAAGGIGTVEGPNGESNYFNGFFNGNGKSIKNYAANVPVFAYTGGDGRIKDLIIDESSSFTFNASELDYMAAVVGYHRGEIENVTVESDITVADAAVTAEKCLGSICGRIVVGSVTGSSYTGNISVPAGFSVSGKKVYVGGIAGRISNENGVISDTEFKGTLDFVGVVNVPNTEGLGASDAYLMLGGIVGSNAGTVSDCEVSSEKTFTAVSPVNDGRYYDVSISNRTRTAYIAAQGGVAGMNSGKIENCVNNASFASFLIAAGASLDEYNLNARYLHTGGVVGYNLGGDVLESTNNGVFYIRSSSRMMYTGGIVGTNTGAVRNCINEATASFAVQTADAKPYGARQTYFGGVIGNNTSSEISGVENKAALKIGRIEDRNSAAVYMGGVMGYSKGSIDGTSARTIRNSGSVSIENAITTIISAGYHVGGVVGCSTASVKNVLNTGNVTHKNTTSLQNLHLSGVVGSIDSKEDVEISGCRNEGEVYFNAATKSASGSVEYKENHLGGILGYSVSNVTVHSCENAGYVHGGNSTKLNGMTLYVGGVVGYLKGKSSISSCTNTSEVYNNHFNNSQAKGLSAYTGGIVAFAEGTAENPVTVTDCRATFSDDTAWNTKRGYLGGIAGYAEYANISGCDCTRNFSCTAHYIGGIAGWLVNGTISDCDWTGTSIVSSELQIGGGIVAVLDAGGVIDGCKSYCTEVAKGGLLAGESTEGSTIKDCHYKAGQTLAICSDTNFTDQNNKADL